MCSVILQKINSDRSPLWEYRCYNWHRFSEDGAKRVATGIPIPHCSLKILKGKIQSTLFSDPFSLRAKWFVTDQTTEEIRCSEGGATSGHKTSNLSTRHYSVLPVTSVGLWWLWTSLLWCQYFCSMHWHWELECGLQEKAKSCKKMGIGQKLPLSEEGTSVWLLDYLLLQVCLMIMGYESIWP